MEQPVRERSLIYALGPYELDAGRLLLLHEGRPVPLGPKVVETLLALVERAGEVMTKDALLERIWPEGYVEEANLAQNVYVLRKTLAAHWNVKPIETIPRRGYRLVADVRVAAPRLPRPQLAAVTPIAPAPRRVTPLRRIGAVAAAVVFAAGIAAATRAHSAPPQRVALSAAGTQANALGRYYWNLRTQQSLQKSIAYFTAVTKSDPKSALGYAGLADAYSMIADYGCQMHECKTTVAQAKRFAARALAVDPQSAEAHTARGVQFVLFAHDERKAEAEYRTAIALDPGYALAHQWYGTALLMEGNMPEARRQLEAAVALQPVATATNVELGMEAYFDHRYARAVSYTRQALDLNPKRMDSWLILGLSQEQLGDAKDALASFRRFGDACKCQAEARLFQAGAYARMGRREDALAALRAAVANAAAVPPDEVAIAFIQLGDRTRALAYMRRVKFKSPSERVFLALDPRMDPVRRDSRFRAWTSAV